MFLYLINYLFTLILRLNVYVAKFFFYIIHRARSTMILMAKKVISIKEATTKVTKVIMEVTDINLTMVTIMVMENMESTMEDMGIIITDTIINCFILSLLLILLKSHLLFLLHPIVISLFLIFNAPLAIFLVDYNRQIKFMTFKLHLYYTSCFTFLTSLI